MSLLWRKQLNIVLRPDRIEVIRDAGGFHSKAQEVKDILVQAEPATPNWSASIAAFQDYIKTIDVKHDITILLSNHFVRFALVPWSPNLSSEEERLSMAGICFENIYGEIARNWELRFSNQGYGKPCIASAVDKDLIDSIKTMASNKKIKLVSMQPWLMATINQHRKQIKEKGFWLIIAEPGRAVLLQRRNDEYVGIKSLLLEGLLPDGLKLIMARELAINPQEEIFKPYLTATGFLSSEITTQISQGFQVLNSKASPASLTIKPDLELA